MKYPVIILALGIGFCFGWIAHPVSSSSTETGKPHQPGIIATRPAPQAQPVNNAQTAGKHVAPAIREFLTRHAENGQITAGGMTNAIEEMSKVNDPLIRRGLFTALLENLSRDNAVAAYTAMLKHSKGLVGHDEDLRLLANVWGRLDPLGAMASIMKIRIALHSGDAPVADTTNPEMIEIVAGWAMTDPDGASRHVERLTDPDKRELLNNGIARGLVARGTDQALAYVSNIPATKENLKIRQRYMGMIANNVVTQHGFEYATKWIETIADPSLKGSGLARIAESTSKWDDLATWVTPYAGDDYAKDAIAVFAKRWGDVEPGAVITWADENFPEAAREIAYREAFGGWTRMDAVAASEVLVNMPPSRLRDMAVGEFARVVASVEPASAIQWAETIGDQARRTDALVSVAETWLKSDTEAATDWLARSSLPEASVKKILATNH